MAIRIGSRVTSILGSGVAKISRPTRRQRNVDKYNRIYGELDSTLAKLGGVKPSARRIARKAELLIAQLDRLHVKISLLDDKMAKRNTIKAEQGVKITNQALVNITTAAVQAHDYVVGDKKPSGKHAAPNMLQYERKEKSSYVDLADAKKELFDAIDDGDYPKAKSAGKKYNRYP